MSGSSETEFNGKRVLVSGATKGMGEAIVQRLGGSRATVVTTARSAPPELPTSAAMGLSPDFDSRVGAFPWSPAQPGEPGVLPAGAASDGTQHIAGSTAYR